MEIKFKLQDIERTIKYDKYCFMAISPRSGRTLGYYSSLGGAIKKHLEDAMMLDDNNEGKEEVIQLKNLVSRYEALVKEVRGLGKADFLHTELEFKDVPRRGAVKSKTVSEKEVENPEEDFEF